jgi:hypothetical protein
LNLDDTENSTLINFKDNHFDSSKSLSINNIYLLDESNNFIVKKEDLISAEDQNINRNLRKEIDNHLKDLKNGVVDKNQSNSLESHNKPRDLNFELDLSLEKVKYTFFFYLKYMDEALPALKDLINHMQRNKMNIYQNFIKIYEQEKDALPITNSDRTNFFFNQTFDINVLSLLFKIDKKTDKFDLNFFSKLRFLCDHFAKHVSSRDIWEIFVGSEIPMDENFKKCTDAQAIFISIIILSTQLKKDEIDSFTKIRLKDAPSKSFLVFSYNLVAWLAYFNGFLKKKGSYITTDEFHAYIKKILPNLELKLFDMRKLFKKTINFNDYEKSRNFKLLKTEISDIIIESLSK